MTEKLKPCPFCGKNPELICQNTECGYFESFFVKCKKCFIEMYGDFYYSTWPPAIKGNTISVRKDAVNSAIAAWNTRHEIISSQESGENHD